MMTSDVSTRPRLARLIAVRAVVVTLLLGGATWAQIAAPGSFPVDPYFFLVGLTFGLTAVYSLTLRVAERRPWIVDVHIGVDVLIVTAFIYLTGGITSFFVSLYALPIVAASLFGRRRGGLAAAGFSACLYTALVLVQCWSSFGVRYESWFVAGAALLPTAPVIQFTVALNLFGFLAIALLGDSLAEGVRSAGARLERASSEIQDLLAFNQDVINSLPSGLITTDTAQRVVMFNCAAEAITGIPRAEAAGRRVAEVLQLPPSLAGALGEGLADPGVRRADYRFSRTGDGRDLDIGLSATSLDSPRGPTGLLVVFQDLTEVKRLERAVEIQQRLAAVGEMAAGIAHEIRNPLASMSGSIQILRQDLPLTAEQAELMDIVLRESERLNATIQSFLAYARPQRFAIARVDVRRALNDTALLLRNSAEAHETHAIEVDVPPVELWHEVDEGQVRQIVWNLATNGLRAMPSGGHLRLSASSEAGESTLITVRDEGMGIPPDALDGLFQPFHGSFPNGSGLGLAIVHRIVADYHGEIEVASTPGAGTTVSVRLPLRAGVLR